MQLPFDNILNTVCLLKQINFTILKTAIFKDLMCRITRCRFFASKNPYMQYNETKNLKQKGAF